VISTREDLNILGMVVNVVTIIWEYIWYITSLVSNYRVFTQTAQKVRLDLNI
jgi:hypothetical protein